MNNGGKRIPVKEGLWSEPSGSDERPRLIGDRCSSCGELFFPRKENGMCSYCQSTDLEEILLSSKGKIYSHTVVMRRPPGYYKGEVPYAIGFVELPEGIRVETLFADCDIESLKVGMDVELVIDKLHVEEDGTEVMTYKFRPFRT